jgi:DNA-dependent RNA polymerase auxiliary subunit epsilon
LLLKIVTNEAEIGLAQKPEVKKVLISKTEYFVNLIKAAIAGAHIDYERSKIGSTNNNDN